MKKRLRITCYYCDTRVVVDFYDMRKMDDARKAMAAAGWILAVAADDGNVIFDPVCHECGRGVVSQMLSESGGQVDPDAKKHLKKLFPELFPDEST